MAGRRLFAETFSSSCPQDRRRGLGSPPLQLAPARSLTCLELPGFAFSAAFLLVRQHFLRTRRKTSPLSLLRGCLIEPVAAPPFGVKRNLCLPSEPSLLSPRTEVSAAMPAFPACDRVVERRTMFGRVISLCVPWTGLACFREYVSCWSSGNYLKGLLLTFPPSPFHRFHLMLVSISPTVDRLCLTAPTSAEDFGNYWYFPGVLRVLENHEKCESANYDFSSPRIITDCNKPINYSFDNSDNSFQFVAKFFFQFIIFNLTYCISIRDST